MTHTQKAAVLLLLVGFGFYGCSKHPADYAGSEGEAAQQAKAQRWEQDYKAAAAARDDYRQKLQAAEVKQAEVQKLLDLERAIAASERETLKTEIKLRLNERDCLQSQYDSFRKNLRDLLAQAESAQTNPNIPVIPTIPNIPIIPTSPLSSPAPALIGSQPLPSTAGTTLSN